MSLFIVGLDSTIVNVALPSIGRELHASVSGLQWTIDAYTLVLASLLMLSGSTADRIGRRRTFQAGLAVFTVGSLLCSLAPGLGWLVAFRMVQAVGGSMLNPVAMSIITNTFTDRRERAQAIGVWGGVFGLSVALGPVAGGALVNSVGWRGIFWVNIPVGIAAIVLCALFVPESKAEPGPPPGSGRAGAAHRAAGRADVRASSRAPAPGGGPRASWGCSPWRPWRWPSSSGTSAVARTRCSTRGSSAVPRSPGRRSPRWPPCAALGGFLFLNTLYLQDVRGFPALTAGLYLLPMAGAMAICSPLSGRIVAARGARIPLVCAGIALIVAGILLTMITDHSSPAFLFPSYVIFGIGIGLVNAPITNSAVSGMPRAAGGRRGRRRLHQPLGRPVTGRRRDGVGAER